MNDAGRTKRYFESLAPVYDASTETTGWMANDALEEELNGIEEAPTAVFDLGTGTGQTVERILAAYPQANVSGFDYSETMLEVASSKIPSVLFEQQDISDFASVNVNRADLITAIGCLEFVPRLPEVLKRLAGMLNPHGTLLFTFEPLIPGLDTQEEATETAPGSILESDDYLTRYRWTINEVQNALRPLSIISQRLFVSYHRKSQPVIYELIRADVG